MRKIVMMAAALTLATGTVNAMDQEQEAALKKAAGYLTIARECEAVLNDNTLVAQAKVNSKTLLARAGFSWDQAIDYVERMAAAPDGPPIPFGETFCRTAIDATAARF